MAVAVVVNLVSPFQDEHDIDLIRYRGCDFCYESATEDIWAGKIAESEWRQFYILEGPEFGGECCCGNCLENVLKGEES